MFIIYNPIQLHFLNFELHIVNSDFNLIQQLQQLIYTDGSKVGDKA